MQPRPLEPPGSAGVCAAVRGPQRPVVDPPLARQI